MNFDVHSHQNRLVACAWAAGFAGLIRKVRLADDGPFRPRPSYTGLRSCASVSAN